MIAGKFHIIDDTSIKWMMQSDSAQEAIPYCALHHLPLGEPDDEFEDEYFTCDECPTPKVVPRVAYRQAVYVANKLRAKELAKIDVINYNGELVPVAKVKTKNDEYWVTAQVMESKHGHQLVVYAGKKGMDGKAQIFVDTENHKLAFDHKDIDPSDVFAKLEATFKDGSKMGKIAPEPTE